MKKRVYVCVNCGGKVEARGDGLKTWHCLNGCLKRHFTVNRRVDSGKELEQEPPYSGNLHIEAWPVRRAIAVRVV